MTNRRSLALLRTLILCAPGPASAEQALLLYGGSEHNEFLGCLNCDRYQENSINKTYGQFGISYSSLIIWNHYGVYGSAYSATGVCNHYAADAPIIIDKSGKFYGRLTLNNYAQGAIKNESLIYWLRIKVCGEAA
jgi:hypothetical protein